MAVESRTLSDVYEKKNLEDFIFCKITDYASGTLNQNLHIFYL
jgi:hypothetical protein